MVTTEPEQVNPQPEQKVIRINIDSIIAESEDIEAKPATHRYITKLHELIKVLKGEVEYHQNKAGEAPIVQTHSQETVEGE